MKLLTLPRTMVMLGTALAIVLSPDSIVGQSTDVQVLNVVARWWNPTFIDGDHLSTVDPAERPGGIFEGQIFYLPAQQRAGTHPVYREYRVPPYDHMDSTTNGEAGYTTEQLLGYAFDSASQQPGTVSLQRYFHFAIFDHMTLREGREPSPANYVREHSLGYGFPRYGTLCESPVTINGAQVTVRGNLAAGGAVSELWWNSKQFVNNWDYGRQIQTAINLSRVVEANNPTEAGDFYGCNALGTSTKPPGRAHGSPVLSHSVTGKTYRTSTSPLQWKPWLHGGGEHNPVRWLGAMSKRVDLDFGSSNAIRWTSTIVFPRESSFLDWDIAIAYLTDEFKSFYMYDAVSSTAQQRFPALSSCAQVQPPSGAGGAIAATSDGRYALGMYRRPRSPAFHDSFLLCNFLFGGATGKYGQQTSVVSMKTRYDDPSLPIPAGARTEIGYLLVGTFSTVKAEMTRLYQDGY